MKQLSLILFAAIIFASCKKDGVSGCISQITGPTPVSATDNATILALMNNNHLSTNSLVFFGYTTYTTGTPAQTYQFAQAMQIRNGLQIFYSNLNYTFVDGTTQSVNGRVYGAVTLNTKPSLSLGSVRKLYIDEAINKQGIDPTFKDSCYVAQFGYFNANIYSADTTANFVKAWEVHLKNSIYPQCYINDANGSTLFFDSGIRPLYDKSH